MRLGPEPHGAVVALAAVMHGTSGSDAPTPQNRMRSARDRRAVRLRVAALFGALTALVALSVPLFSQAVGRGAGPRVERVERSHQLQAEAKHDLVSAVNVGGESGNSAQASTTAR